MAPRSFLIHRSLALAIGLLALHAGCGGDVRDSGPGEAIGVGRISWSATRRADVGRSRPVFETLAQETIGALPALRVKDARPVADLRGVLDVAEEGRVIVLEAKVRGEGLEVPIEVGIAAKAGNDATGNAEADDRALMESALLDLSRALRSMFGIYSGGETAWVRALDSAEADEQIMAARLLGRAGAASAIEPLCRLLTDPREQVADAAAEALAAIGDKRAVPMIIESIGRGDLRREVRAIEAMAAIGGPEARAYLEMTAVGHEVPEVRRVSAAALDRMRR